MTNQSKDVKESEKFYQQQTTYVKFVNRGFIFLIPVSSNFITFNDMSKVVIIKQVVNLKKLFTPTEPFASYVQSTYINKSYVNHASI